MSDQKKRISELPESTSTEGLITIGVNAQNESVKIPIGNILKGYDSAKADAAKAKTDAAQAKSDASTAKTDASQAKTDAAQAKSDAAQAKEAAQSVQDTSMLVSGTGLGSGQLKGGGNIVEGTKAVGLGTHNTVKGYNGFAAGEDNIVTGNEAMAMGDGNTASGNNSLAEGHKTTASGSSSHSEGKMTSAEGAYSHAEGQGTKAVGECSHAEGSYNVGNSDTIHEVGIGTDDTHRKNAQEIKKDGKMYVHGIGGYDGTNAGQENVLSIQEAFVKMGSDVEEGISQKVDCALFINANRLLNNYNPMTLETVLGMLTAGDESHYYIIQGVVLTFLGTEGRMVTWQWLGDMKVDFAVAETWQKFGGSASVGNCYNVTNDMPLQSGYYDLEKALAVTFSKGYTNIGVQVTFAIAKGSWKTYQYIGEDSDEATFKNVDNWLDLAGMSAGAETLINVDALCGACKSSAYYTLEYAIAAIQALSQSTGISYAKGGLVITYKVNDATWETKQFKGIVSDFGEASLWQDFGGGGSKVETKDEPEEGGKDALSTGGAYANIPTNIKLDTETEGIVKMQLQNAKKEAIGDEIQFSVGTGGGGGGGTIVTMAFEESPLYGNAGGSFVMKAAVRSVTMVGSQEQTNMIASIDLYDRDTNTLIETFPFNRASSASIETYDFELDVTSYFGVAGVRRFKCLVTDDAGNTGSRNINVTAVDVTISSVQTLQYTPSTALSVGGSAKNFPLYKFANNSSDKGITAITEMYLNGQWREIGSSSIQDTYSHSISIDPMNCLGVKLSHGAYPIRVHGVDNASGVVGNYLYTGIFVIAEGNTTPIIVESWYSDKVNASVKLYETISVNYAVYDPAHTEPMASIYLNGVKESEHIAYRSGVYTYNHQVTGVSSEGDFSHIVKVGCGTSFGVEASFLVYGSVIDAVLKEGAIYALDFSNRSNEESDHTIKQGEFELKVVGSNYSTTGFKTFLGKKCLRIAEDVEASLNHYMFKDTSIENNGAAIQFTFASNNLVNDDAVLMECYDESTGAGFYVTGKCVAIYCSTGLTNHVEERRYKQGKEVTVDVVVEPAVEGLGKTRSGTTYYFLKLYLDGEEVACIGYVAGQSNLIQEKNIKWHGKQGDFYLYNIIGWNDYFLFEQAFQNYLVKLTDTAEMVKEYNFEDVMASQQVFEYGESTTKSRPQANLMHAGGMPYIIECPYDGSDIEVLDHTTSTDDKINVTLYYFDPQHPWRSFVAYKVQRKNQGTTSTLRPVKNPRYYLGKAERIEPLFPDYTNEEALLCYKLFKALRVLIGENNIPVQTITVKVDFSDSGGANDCGVCDMMNATYRAAGSLFMTPAQRAFNGTWSGSYTEGGETKTISMSGLVMNHSTANHPVAVFRSKNENGSNPYFHAKGNWKMDKKEELALGFKDTPGYNKGCLNWDKFVAYYGTPSETLTQIKTRFLSDDNLDTSKVYGLMLYCGRDFKVMRYKNGAWGETTGSMQQIGGKWQITGDVINPVEGFELLQYQDMDWFMGVASVDDLMKPTTNMAKWVKKLVDSGDVTATSFPAWTQYFESLIDCDSLAIDYAMGKRVPYNLLQWMIHCNKSDYTKLNLSTCKQNWKDNTWKYASIRSMDTYGAFTDYLAAIDQQAKNMQPMWFLEDGHCIINGVFDPSGYVASDLIEQQPMIMYWNKVYDADGVNSKDNDGGCTVDAETDPNKDNDATFTNPYAGHGSILFKMMFYEPENVINSAGETLTVKNVVATLRSAQITEDGLTFKPFSPEGATYYFITKRLKRWQKRVSSYDGERKYIDFTATSDTIYFYALQGLGLTALPDFIERRWRFRDGYYQTGDFFSGILSGRIACPSSATIKIRAAKSGYFGIGNDSAGSLTESVYLEAGQTHTFTKFSHESGALLYIYQADRMSMIDLSELSLSNNFDFSVMTLAEEIYIGKVGKTNLSIGSYTLLTNLNLGELPFLKKLDIRGTLITNLVCSSCPRLESLYAANSQLARADIADGAKITYMQLPATYSYLKLRYLPNLTLSGLELADKKSVSTLIVENNAHIDSAELLRQIAGASGSNLRVVRATPISENSDGSDLTIWKSLGLSGLDANLTAQASPAIIGTYMLTRYTDDAVLASWQSAFPELTIHQSQYTLIEQDDTLNDPANVTNLDNHTSGDNYAPSGHVAKIRKLLIPVVGKLNAQTGVFEAVKLSEDNYRLLSDGSDFDYTDSLGSGKDAFMRIPHLWYKGINDFKNQKKYIAWSSLDSEPISSATRINRKRLSDIVYSRNMAIFVDNIILNRSKMDTDNVLVSTANYNTYQIDVEGMKQVRYPGLNSANIGACFLNEDGVIISKYNMAVANTLFDFVEGDYIFIDVPSGAKTFVFTSANTNATLEAIAVDSSEIEAIEPDWVESEECLGAIYQASIDTLRQIRSVSGASVRVGTGTQTTSSEWKYDAEGYPTNNPTGNLNYTGKDFMNLAKRRGKGYQLFDYEMSKLMAILFYSMTGNRDAQLLCGYGKSAGGSTGYTDTLGNTDTYQGQMQGNKCLGFESFFGCTWEFMDNVAVNVPSFAQAMIDKMSDSIGTYPIDAKWHIFDPISKTERVVQGITTSGYCIARVKHGRFCDVIASKCSSDNSKWAANYCDANYYTASRCRVVGRSNRNAGAFGGVAYAHADHAASLSSTYGGSRLAFRGKIEIK